MVVIDVINDLEFEGAEALERPAKAMAAALAPLLTRAREGNIPVIYANDNFGRWRSDFHAQIEHCLNEDVRGREIVRQLHPGEEDYFILKPKHSAFFATAFDTLLAYLNARTLVLAGLSTDSCILATAIDADMRDLHVVVAEDCVAAMSPERHERALEHLRETLDVRLVNGADVDFEALLAESGEQEPATSQARARATPS
jgi:nicotinamidase-related amidase